MLLFYMTILQSLNQFLLDEMFQMTDWLLALCSPTMELWFLDHL